MASAHQSLIDGCSSARLQGLAAVVFLALPAAFSLLVLCRLEASGAAAGGLGWPGRSRAANGVGRLPASAGMPFSWAIMRQVPAANPTSRLLHACGLAALCTVRAWPPDDLCLLHPSCLPRSCQAADGELCC